MRTKNVIFSFLTFILVINSYYAFSVPITIIKNHIAKANIVIDENSSQQIKDVAKILQDYLKKSTGVTLNIENRIRSNFAAINIGNTALAKSQGIVLKNLDQDSYLLKSVDQQNFLIVGKTEWGTEFGVYDFLERFLGVRWLMPTDLGTDVPIAADVIIPDSKIIQSPSYLSRDLWPIGRTAIDDPLSQWGRFNRLKANVECIHNLNKLFNPADPVTSNAKFYSNGVAPRGTDHNWQPNFSAAGISDVAATKIINYFSQNPQKGSYSLGINDSGNFDESTESTNRRRSRKNRLDLEDVSDDYYLWANDVAKKVNTIYPDKLFGTLAYKNLIEPPSDRVTVNPNIIPFITMERLRWANSQFKSSDKQLSQSWSAKAKTVGWYDYDYGWCYLLPRVWFHTMQDYLSWGNQNNVKYYCAELYPNWGEGPKSWLLAKLLWNPNQNVDSLLNDWYTSFAGPSAAPKLKAYYDIWEKYWTNDIQNSSWYNLKDQYLKFNDLTYMNNIPASYVTQSVALLNDAYRLADSPIRKKRVNELIKMWNVYKYAIFAVQKYKARALPTLKLSPEFMTVMNQLGADTIHNSSMNRIFIYMSLPQKKL